MTREEAERADLGRAIRQAREAAGLSVRGLAARIRVSPATMSAVEHGRTRVTADRLHDLGAALGVSATDLRAGRVRSEQGGPTGPVGGAGVVAPWRVFGPLPIDAALRGAIAAFVAYGYHGASMRDIAEYAGISVPGVYHHYASKHDLLVRALDLAMSDLTWRLAAAGRECDSRADAPPARLIAHVEALALFHASRTDLAFIGASEMRSLRPAERRRIARLRTDVQRRIDAEIALCIRHGDLPEQDEAGAGRAITSMCVSICQWFDPDGPLGPEEIARQHATFAVRLVGGCC